jgi:hypothetical protein
MPTYGSALIEVKNNSLLKYKYIAGIYLEMALTGKVWG